MSLMGVYALRNEETEEECTLDADDFIWEDASQSGEQYRFVHFGTEELPEVIATFDIEADQFVIQMPPDFEELENGLYIHTGGDEYDSESEYGYDQGYDD